MFSLRSLRLALAAIAIAAAASATPVEAQLNAQEQQIASLLTNASGQQRPLVQVDPILSQVARARAADMAKRRYFDHVNPDGHGPNYLVRQAGYLLPASYDASASANNLESIAAGDPTAEAAWNGWMGSAPHKNHLLAQASFYVAQTSLGVGYYFDAGSEYQHYWVVITAPPAEPALSITSPAVNAGLKVPQAAISGTSGGSPGVARVVYRLENSAGVGPYRDATGQATWSGVVAGLVPGPNTVRVRSLDGAGTVLKELTRTFRYVVLKPLIVATEGTGTVTAGFLGTSSRELGVRYSITATAPAGWLFDHWSGSAGAATPALSFVMAEGFTLTAHFRVNPFHPLKGAYNGLVQAGVAAHATSGFLKLSLATTGTFSGRLTLGGKAWPFSGKFDSAGAAVLAIKRTGLPPLTLSLTLDLAGGTRRITGSVSDGTSVAAIAADQALPAPAKHFAAGRYTISLPPNPGDTSAAVPKGAGFILLVVSPAGLASLTGTLADGRAFTASATVSKDGELPIYLPLLLGTGSVAGRAAFHPQTGALSGTVLWTRPVRPLDRYHPAGFVTRIAVAGARYTPRPPGVPAMAVPATQNNLVLHLTAGDLPAAVQQPATLLPSNLVTITNPQLPKLTLTITPATGRFAGTFTHPLTKTTSRITGVILQDRNTAAGFFLGQSASGAASFAPAP